MATLAELQADLATCQTAITQAETVQSYSQAGRSKNNALLDTLYAERRRLREEVDKVSFKSGRRRLIGGTPC